MWYNQKLLLCALKNPHDAVLGKRAAASENLSMLSFCAHSTLLNIIFFASSLLIDISDKKSVNKPVDALHSKEGRNDIVYAKKLALFCNLKT